MSAPAMPRADVHRQKGGGACGTFALACISLRSINDSACSSTANLPRVLAIFYLRSIRKFNGF